MKVQMKNFAFATRAIRTHTKFKIKNAQADEIRHSAYKQFQKTKANMHKKFPLYVIQFKFERNDI